MNLFDQKAYLSPRNGFAIMFALIIGTVMLILAVSLFTFSGHQHQGIQNIVNGEIAHFLAEAGINSCIGTVREAISREFNNGNQQSKLKQLLLQPGDIEDTSINDLLDDTWNAELESFAREVDSMKPTQANGMTRSAKKAG
jgi:type II secretory pathway component PulK